MDKNYEIITISFGLIKIFVIKGKSIILIDTGVRKYGKKLITELDKLGIKPKVIALIILTHGHNDHIGSLPYLKERTQAKVLIHKNDMYSITEGRNVPIYGRNWFARLFLGFVVKDRIPNYACVQPDIVVEDEYSLCKFGVNAIVMSTPGHTPGSISICLEDEAITGDLIQPVRWSFIMSALMCDRDIKTSHDSINRVLERHPKKIYISHGEVCDYKTIKNFLFYISRHL